MPAFSLLRRSSNRAAALIIVLAFVVLLTGLALAYLSRTTSERQQAQSSYNDTSSDLLARSALDVIVSDLKQEIVNGSSAVTPTPGTTIYVPTPAANIIPQRSSQIAAGVPNLIRQSVRSDAFIGNPAPPSRASAVNSTNDVSANGRSVSSSRWNGHYLVPKKNTGTDDSIPIDAFTNATPDWVIVTRAGPTPFASWDATLKDPSNSNYATGRYAYAVYDEGGLLDMDAAGYPSPTTMLQYGRKGSLAFSDLTALPGLSTTAVDNIVGWRNYASAQPTGTPIGTLLNFSFSTNATNTYYDFILSDPTNIQLPNYLVSPTPAPMGYFTNSFLTTSGAVTPSPSPSPSPRTDQQFVARQDLIDLRSAVSSNSSSVNALQSLGTFSREALANVPQWTGPSPNPSPAVNPNFQTLFVTSPGFTRNDGNAAAVGDPYLNKRFLLERLNWLTYRGPSATRTIPTSAPALGNADYDMWLLTRPDVNSVRFGLTSAFLQQGTAANIQKYFGLVWDSTNERWNYTSPLGGSLASSIANLSTLTGTREPDFFELLEAGILDGSIGDSLSTDPALPWPLTLAQSKMLHILTIGANLIAQSRADSYPLRIACNIGGTAMEALGMPRLPCLSSLAVCPVGVSGGNGGVNWFLIPNLWDPFRDTWDLTEANAGNIGNGPLLTPGYLRPPVRITIQGTGAGNTASVGFGRIPTAAESGSVDPTSVITFPLAAISSINPNSLVLATGNTTPSGFGRDGLLEAKRLGLLDINLSVSPVASFVPSTSTNAPPTWNDIVRPSNDSSTYRADDFVVFRLSFVGNSVPGGSQNLYPVLVLQSGFQVTLDYQSPNGQWYSYSFLQGNNATNTWITSASGLCLATKFSQYGSGAKPTIVNTGTSTTTLWTGSATGGILAVAKAPMFAKADPRNPRYSSRIGVVNVANPPLPWACAGILGPIWPSQYTISPAPMTASGYPIPTPTGTIIPGTLGDNTNAGNGANPYNELIPTPTPTPGGQVVSVGDSWRPVMMNRPFRSVGEMAYAFRDQPFKTLSFSSSNSPDAGLLDLFTTNDYSGAPGPATPTPTPTSTPGMRGGVISLNSRQAPALASVLTSTIRREDTARQTPVPAGGSPSPQPLPLGATDATNIATTFTSLTSPSPVINRADLARLIANTNPVGFDATVPKTQRESIARAFGETVQTRTWNLLIDLVAQTGSYKPNATGLQNDFVVKGEEHYWVHLAIDRFTNQVIDKRIELVKE
jgi:hypothetical protein